MGDITLFMDDKARASSAAKRREPRFLPQTDPQAPPTARPDVAQGGNAAWSRLLPLAPVPQVPGKPVRGTSTPLIRRELYADPTLTPILVASLLAHALLLAALFYKAATHSGAGSPQASQSQPVEVVFSQPDASSGMVGQPSPEAGGGNEAKKASQASTTPPTPAEAQPSPSNEEETHSLPLPQSDDGLPKPEKTHPTPRPSHPATGHAHPTKTPARPAPHPRPSTRPSHHTPSPFDHPMDLSFDEAPAPRRRRSGRPGGSGAPIDLSIGPMVQNGELNAHYASRTSVKGVSSDYASEIDSWIRRHLYYPPEAAQRGEEGGSSVHVILDRTGRVFKVFETNSSGSTELDASTVGMFQGAQLPPIPPDMKDRFINFDVTVNYILIRN